MFKMASEVLKGTVTQLAKGARKSKLGEKMIFLTTTEDGNVVFYVNGDELSVERQVPAEIQGSLKVATSVKELYTKVSALPNETDITVELKGTLLKLRWGKKSEICCEIVPETSPRVTIPKIDVWVTWRPGALQSIARMLPMFTANPAEQKAISNPSIAGPNFSKGEVEGECFVRGTDSNRAITFRTNSIQWFDEPISLESSTLSGVAELLPDEAEIKVGISANKGTVLFQSGTTKALVRILTGTYPTVDRAYDYATKSKWTFDRQDLLELCRRVRTLSLNPHKPGVEFRIKDGKVHAVMPNILDQSVSVGIEGEPCEFAVNASYLEMAAAVYLKAEQITLFVNGPDRPISIRAEDNDDIRALVLPYRLL
ncbi:hypothetical protein [Brevibacillus sp. 179-C9.3 HS]|uniref:hypothetical protein n=1 Tax=unclassified Brevibacillus TaxID=2684853 RepID=UPI0039A0F12A